MDNGHDAALLKRTKKSRYNSKLYLTKCALCDEVVDEVHHIIPQASADERGSLGHFGMNHRYNLIPLCAMHHKLVHEGKIAVHGFVMSEEGLRLSYTEKLDTPSS